MPRKPKFLLSGRASFVGLVLLIVCIGSGCLILARKASAQAGSASTPLVFAPVTLNPINSMAGAESLTVNIMLPAVATPRTPFRMQVFANNDDYITIDLPATKTPTNLRYIVSLDNNNNDIQVFDPAHDAFTRLWYPADSTTTVRIYPAVRQNGQVAAPLSAGMTIYGSTSSTVPGSNTYTQVSFYNFVNPIP